MRQGFAHRLVFLRAFVTHPSLVGAVLPTSRRAVRDMLDMADVRGADVVVELGPGTGVYTQEILLRLRSDARLVALERDVGLVRLLRERFNDPRLRVICDSAENLRDHLGDGATEVVVSGLPLTSLGGVVRRRVLTEIVRVLAPGGTALVLQYSPKIQAELGRFFPSVRRRLSPLNVPPAFLFACSLAQQGPAAKAAGGT